MWYAAPVFIFLKSVLLTRSLDVWISLYYTCSYLPPLCLGFIEHDDSYRSQPVATALIAGLPRATTPSDYSTTCHYVGTSILLEFGGVIGERDRLPNWSAGEDAAANSGLTPASHQRIKPSLHRELPHRRFLPFTANNEALLYRLNRRYSFPGQLPPPIG